MPKGLLKAAASNLETTQIDQISIPDLQAPPGLTALFPEDSVATVNSKLVCVEALLNLVNKDIKFPDFIKEILQIVSRVLKSEAGSILELDPSNNTLFFRATIGQSSDQLTKFTVPMGQGIVGYVAESHQPLVVSNVEENAIYLKSIQDAVGFTARNVICAPILIRGRVYGVLELLNRVGEEGYSNEDVELLTYMCDMASKVIEARLMLAWAMRDKKQNNEPGQGFE